MDWHFEHPLRSFIAALIGLTLFAPAAGSQPKNAATATADIYPHKPIRIVAGFPPAGSNDILARFLAARLTERYGQQVIVDNRPGANGIIGTELASKAAPDGYTLLFVSLSHTMNAALRSNLPYDPVKSFSPVGMMATGPNVLIANPSFPARTVKELIALAKAKPGQIQYASTGVAGINHFGGELLKRIAGIDLLHVPYKGGGPATVAVISGEVPLSVSSLTLALPNIRTAKVRAIGVGGAQRSPLLPDVPTLAESGAPGYNFTIWWGVLSPARTPSTIVALLNSDMREILNQPETSKRLEGEAVEPAALTPAEFRKIIAADVMKWTKLAREANIKAE